MQTTFIHQPIPLVLASGSPIRAQMLKSVGLSFSVVPSNVDEAKVKQGCADTDLPQLAVRLARAKALWVAKDYPDHLTIGADQVCELEGGIINKPEGFDNAVAQLKALRGKTHHQHSAFCVVRGDQVLDEKVDTATLEVRSDLTDAAIRAYVHADRPLQSCGSYKFEQLGRHLFARAVGDHDTIKGLPLLALLAALHRLGAVVLGEAE